MISVTFWSYYIRPYPYVFPIIQNVTLINFLMSSLSMSIYDNLECYTNQFFNVMLIHAYFKYPIMLHRLILNIILIHVYFWYLRELHWSISLMFFFLFFIYIFHISECYTDLCFNVVLIHVYFWYFKMVNTSCS